MKPRTKFVLFLAVVGAVAGGGVVHTTRFAEPGIPGAPQAPTDEQRVLGEVLREHLRHQTIDIGRREAARDGASWAMLDYLTFECASVGFTATTQEYKADGRIHQNVIVEKPGRTKDIVLIGCHYDAFVKSPSANATASGTAAVIEVMKMVADVPTDRTLRFGFFGTGEPPFRGTEQMGSRQYAIQCREAGDPLAAVLIVDSFGCFTSEPGSQGFFFPWNMVFPTTGDFVMVVGDASQRPLVKETLDAWARSNEFPARGLALRSWLAGIRCGDQDAFTAEGFPAVLITDTGAHRFDGIRTRADTFDRLDYVAFAQAVQSLGAAVIEVAGR